MIKINKSEVMLYDVYEGNEYIGRMIGRHIIERYLGENAKTKGVKVSNVPWLENANVQIIPSGETIYQHIYRMPYQWCSEWDKTRLAILKFKKKVNDGQKS